MQIFKRVFEMLAPHHARKEAEAFLRYLGPGLLITVGFIDPGNWASNLAAGADFGYSLLWIVTLATIILIILQHNAAHLGIVTGDCLAEACTRHVPRPLAGFLLITAFLAAVATALAEILGSAIALNMLFNLPIWLGAVLSSIAVMALLWSNSYPSLEKIIIGFVSLIGISFLVQLALVGPDWSRAAYNAVVPSLPHGSLFLILSVLGAVVMPHNLFLHSEVIQSRHWNLEDEAVIKRQLRFEFMDTLVSMGIGWAINSAMLLVAAVVFYENKIHVTDLAQAAELLAPLLGSFAFIIFALALLLAGLSSSATAAMAGSSIFAGFFGEPYDIKDLHSQLGAGLTFLLANLTLIAVTDPFEGLIVSQFALSLQLPLTIFLQLYLTSSKKVMGKFANNTRQTITLVAIGIFVSALNIMLLFNA